MQHHLRLRTKIIVYFLGLLILCFVIVISSIWYLLNKSSRQLLRGQGIQITRALASECVPFVHYEDILELNNLLEQQLSSVPDIRYIALFDNTGNTILSSFKTGASKSLPAVTHSAGNSEDVSVQFIRFEGKLFYDYETKRGDIRVRLGLSLSSVQEAINHTIIYVSLIGIGGLLAAFAIALYVSRPIEILTTAIERAVSLDQETGRDDTTGGTIETTAIANSFHELMNRLEERTKQLDASKKLAYLGEISTSIAHEVNNPLGVIVMNSEFLMNRSKQGEFTPAAAKEVERLANAAKKATLAVQKLLQFARYTTRSGEVRYKPVRLEPLVREIVALLEERLQCSRLFIYTDIPKDIPPISCDEQGLQQVLFNLLTNAIDASPDDKRIGIRATLNNKFLLLQVADEGGGMNEDVLKRAKEPFFTTKDSDKGTGLGLAISDSIVRAHGGELILDSKPGSGTTATLKLPMRENI